MLESSTNANVNNTHIHAFSFITIAQMKNLIIFLSSLYTLRKIHCETNGDPNTMKICSQMPGLCKMTI